MKTNADDLKSLPLSEVEKKLGSSPDGLTQADLDLAAAIDAIEGAGAPDVPGSLPA